MIYLAIKDWEEHQIALRKAKRRDWICLETSLLDNRDYRRMPAGCQILIIRLWLLRGRLGHNIPKDYDYLADLCGQCKPGDLDLLINQGWLIETGQKRTDLMIVESDDNVASAYESVDYPEDFEKWWAIYPKKSAKADAAKAWKQVEKIRPPIEELIKATEAYAKSVSDPQYIKLPAGWLRSRRWDDMLETAAVVSEEQIINRKLDAESAKHFAHPKWKAYVEQVVSGEAKAGFEGWLNEHQ